MNIESIGELIGLIAGSGGLASYFTLKYTKMQARGEARSAENQATKELQDIYQRLVEDVKKDREEKKQEIEDLKVDRNHYREERNELRNRVDDLCEKIRRLELDVANNCRVVESMIPLLCERECSRRIYGRILGNASLKPDNKEDDKFNDDCVIGCNSSIDKKHDKGRGHDKDQMVNSVG